MRAQANLKCPEGLTVSGDLVVPPGNVYVNFKIKDEPPQEDAPVRGVALWLMARDSLDLACFLTFACLTGAGA